MKNQRLRKMRLDLLLVARGHFDSRTKAQAAILAGDVAVGGVLCDKSGVPVSQDADISIKTRSRWVGRGAEKLLAAFQRFGVSCEGRVCMDVGAGSGGFTQVMLEKGAAKVYAVDVGYGQFDLKLRGDPRVVLLERTNARNLSAKEVPDPAGFFSMDVSFISIFKILPALRPLLSLDADGVILFKPNFEAKKGEVQKGGLLLDQKIHERLLVEACEFLAAEGWVLSDLIPSPIRGGDGNVEYLLSVARGTSVTAPPDKILAVVAEAFETYPAAKLRDNTTFDTTEPSG